MASTAFSPAPAGGASGGGGGSGGSGFSTNVILQQPNSSGAEVNTLQLTNTYVVNTAGSETADWDGTLPVAGVQTLLRFGRANLAGPAAVTTSGSTPTVVFPPRASAIQITLGALATKLLITGLNLAADLGYDFSYFIPTANPPSAEIDLKLNDTDSTASLHGFDSGASIAADFSNNLYFAFTRTGPQHGLAQLRDTGSGNPKAYMIDAWDNTIAEHLMGRSTLTANVTSISLNGVPVNTVITISKILPSIA